MSSFNLLSSEKSPYLQQHKNNPVHWFAWSEKAFEEATRLDRPIFVSIGYSTCYWCHVMERESFESQIVADYLNEHFVCIKVDREERPDIDRVYMDAVVALRHQGGWPLSVFLTPDKKPFFGGTYFPRDKFLDLLGEIVRLWQDERKRIFDSAAHLDDHLRAASERTLTNTRNPSMATGDLCSAFLTQCSSLFDSDHGGFGSAPKFPHTEKLRLLMALHQETQRREVLGIHRENPLLDDASPMKPNPGTLAFGSMDTLLRAKFCLEQMARGGIYDQLGGGFHRYSTDHRWTVPHFEKMLYDNALLAQTYLEAYQHSKELEFADIARETLDYMSGELQLENGGFASAHDAGEVGKEGEFYVWDFYELAEILTSTELTVLSSHFEISKSGNFEHDKIVLRLQEHSLLSSRSDRTLGQIKEKLFAHRAHRIAPFRDEKILASWNALAISAFAKAYQVLEDTRYLDVALRAGMFFLETLLEHGFIYRRYCAGERKHRGCLDDYAYTISAFLELYESTFDDKWYVSACLLQESQNALFWDSANHSFRMSADPDLEALPMRTSFEDDALPSPNAISAQNLLRISRLNLKNDYADQANLLLTRGLEECQSFPAAYATLLRVEYIRRQPLKEVVILGNLESHLSKNILKAIYRSPAANITVAASQKETSTVPLINNKPASEDESTAYICNELQCYPACSDLSSALGLLGLPLPN